MGTESGWDRVWLVLTVPTLEQATRGDAQATAPCSWVRADPVPVQPSTGLVGRRPPEGRLQGNLTLLMVPPAQGLGTGRGLGLSTGQGYQKDCEDSGQMAQEYGAAPGLSVSRGAPGPFGPTPWLRSVPRSYDQDP